MSEQALFTDAAEVIRKFAEFLEQHYYAAIIEQARIGKRYVETDFAKLAEFDPVLADYTLESPEDAIAAANEAIKEFDIGKDHPFFVRFLNLPRSAQLLIRNIRSENLNRLYMFEGTVRNKSEVRPHVTTARFECPSCGNVIPILQLDKKFLEPSKCSCGRKGKFRLLSKELVDAQTISLEEAADQLEGGQQPKRITVFLKNDLVSPLGERKTNPGQRVHAIGVVKEVPIQLRSGGQSTKFDLIVEANAIDSVQEDFYDIAVSEEDKEQIMEIVNDPRHLQRLAQSVAPSIYGHDKIKEALVLQLAGGTRKTRDDGQVTRGDVHILLIGDPGAGKCARGSTQIMLKDGTITSLKQLHESQQGEVYSVNLIGEQMTSAPVRYWRRKAPEKMLRITTQSGSQIEVTQEHPLFTTYGGLIFAREAQEYNVNDYLALPSKLTVSGSLQRLSSSFEKTRANNRKSYVLPTFLTSGVARFLGYLVGDGYVRLRKTTGFVSFTNTDPKLLDDFESLAQNLFNVTVTKRKKQSSSAFEYYFSSIDIVRWLSLVSPDIVKRSDEAKIPDAVLKSSDSIVKAFLNGLFDSEGSVNAKKREIEISSKSKTLLDQLKWVLLRFGICSQFSSMIKYASNTKNKTRRKYYRIRISGEDADLFMKEIGFISPRKQLKSWPKNRNTNRHIVPHVRTILKLLRKEHGLAQADFCMPRSTYQHYERGDRNPSVKHLKRICSVYQKLNSKSVFFRMLVHISKADIFWDRIKSIEEFAPKDKYVYDLEIERVHNYVANGVVIHNSQLLKRTSRVAPRGRFISGKGVSGAGLTASVIRDEFLGGWSLEAGALVLAHRGVCCIDELDKMSNEDRSAMHEALEGQTITISKANIQATLRCETTVLAAANPKLGRFDPYDTIVNQIDLPPALINRFDLIFPVKDIPDAKRDEKLATFILDLHRKAARDEKTEGEIETGLFRKYLAYARQNFQPILTEGAIEELRNYYISMRSSGKQTGGVQSIPISPRQLEGLVRLAEARAKVRFSKTVEKEDAKKAIELLDYCLRLVAYDEATGTIDIDRIATDTPASKRNKILTVKEVIKNLEKVAGKTIPFEDILKACKDKGLSEDEVEEIIQKLKRQGDLFEPKKGFLSQI